MTRPMAGSGTVMVYLNSVEEGGETCFKRLGVIMPGMALAWNNLQADGTPNPFTLHEANGGTGTAG